METMEQDTSYEDRYCPHFYQMWLNIKDKFIFIVFYWAFRPQFEEPNIFGLHPTFWLQYHTITFLSCKIQKSRRGNREIRHWYRIQYKLSNYQNRYLLFLFLNPKHSNVCGPSSMICNVLHVIKYRLWVSRYHYCSQDAQGT